MKDDWQGNMCAWCEVSKASTGRRDGERYCSDCDPYAWAAFVNPDTYEENKRIALMRVERRLAKAEVELVASEQEDSPTRSVLVKELVVARIAFAGMFLAVLVAVAGIFIVGGKC